MFRKAKTTFGFQSGRRGMPSQRRPVVTKRGFRGTATIMSKKTSRGPIGKAKVVSSSKKPVTGKAKGLRNSYRTSKAVPFTATNKKHQATGAYYMSKRTKGTSPKQDSIDKRLGAYFSGIKTSY